MPRRYEKALTMVARRVAGELLLVPIRHDVGDLQCIYSVNAVGSRIWDLITSGQTPEAIVQVLSQEFEVEAEQARADVADFLAQLEDVGAIVTIDEGDHSDAVLHSSPSLR